MATDCAYCHKRLNLDGHNTEVHMVCQTECIHRKNTDMCAKCGLNSVVKGVVWCTTCIDTNADYANYRGPQ